MADKIAFEEGFSLVGAGREAETLAEGVTLEAFFRDYAGQHVEWVEGAVVGMSPVTGRHDAIVRFLSSLLDTYLAETGEGQLRQDPFVMVLPALRRARQPDLLVVTGDNLAQLKETRLEGAADLVIEVVSAESSPRDRGAKFQEYQAGGVREYWIVDPIAGECPCYVRDEAGIFKANPPGADGIYQSVVLPRLRLNLDVLLGEPVPRTPQAVALVAAMLGRAE